jgi:hypothetical protein
LNSRTRTKGSNSQTEEPQLDGTARAPRFYYENHEDDLFAQFKSPKILPMSAFTAHGLMIVMPHRGAIDADFFVSVR